MLLSNNLIKLNKFFKSLFIKKQHINKLKKQLNDLQFKKQQNYKYMSRNYIQKDIINNTTLYDDNLIMYIIDITFSKSNTLMHVTDTSGKLIFFCSAGLFKFEGKRSKKRRFLVFRSMNSILLTKLKFLKNRPIALHLKNVGSNRYWIIKKLKSKFFIKIIKNFTLFPYNGCRKKKIRRKKIRTKKKFRKKRF